MLDQRPDEVQDIQISNQLSTFFPKKNRQLGDKYMRQVGTFKSNRTSVSADHWEAKV